MKLKVFKVFEAWIKAMQDNGIKCDSPYDLENFLSDHGSHSRLIDAGLFPKMIDDDEE